MPPEDEQRAIADFLDRETAKINMLVAKKRTLIERLQEKRTALISRTVTRGLPPDAARAAGLDPHPKLKPTGIAWLGEVPEHWAVEGDSSVLVERISQVMVRTPKSDDPETYYDRLKPAPAWVRISGLRRKWRSSRDDTSDVDGTQH